MCVIESVFYFIVQEYLPDIFFEPQIMTLLIMADRSIPHQADTIPDLIQKEICLQLD
jgi:hypothetical protein